MRLRTAWMMVGVAALWLPDRGDPRRAGQGEAARPETCPEVSCRRSLHLSDKEYVCDGGHAFVLDPLTNQLSRVED